LSKNLIFQNLKMQNSILIKEYENSGKYYENNLLDKTANDYYDLSIIANEFAKHGNIVEILPRLHFKDILYKQTFDGAYTNKCPDLKINNKFYEYESYVGEWNKHKIFHMLKKGLIQSNNIIIDLRSAYYTDDFIKRSIFNRLDYGTKINEVWGFEDNEIRLIFKNTKPE